MLRVEIDRRTWYRGKGSIRSALLNSDGSKCCVGFMCLAAGAEPEDILNIGTVRQIIDYHPETEIPEAFACVKEATPVWLSRMYGINDVEMDMTPEVREAELIAEAAKGGFELVFIN